MVGIHGYLGVAALALNVLAVGYGLWPRMPEGRLRSVAGIAHGALAVQLVAGFLLVGTGGGGPGPLHVAGPLAAFAVVVLVRARAGSHARAIALSSIAIVVAGAISLTGGLTMVD